MSTNELWASLGIVALGWAIGACLFIRLTRGKK